MLQLGYPHLLKSNREGLALFIRCILILLLLVCFPFCGISENGSNEAFNDDFLKSASEEAQDLYVRQIIQADSTIFAYLSNGAVYAYDDEDPSPRLYCHLPLDPRIRAPYSQLQAEEKDRVAETIQAIAYGDGTLWGINIYIGKVGEITQEGIAWSDTQLDITPLVSQTNGWMYRIPSAFVRSGSLYVYIALDDGPYPLNNYEMIVYDLSNGSYKELDIQNTQGYCEYSLDDLLLLRNNEERGYFLSKLNLNTGAIDDLPVIMPDIADSSVIGGLVYDPSLNRIFVCAENIIWSSTQGEPFEKVGQVAIPSLLGETVAWLQSDNRYAIVDGKLYICDINKDVVENDTLYIQGIVDSTYRDFVEENPEISVVVVPGSMSSPDDIAQDMVLGNTSVDIYEVFADSTFTALKNKGYAADLSASSWLTADIQSMYPAIQQLLKDENGNPVAYPKLFLLGNWQVNEALWYLVFGDIELPQTYEEFLDAMILWEKELADNYPEIDFVMNFDHADWVKRIISAYAQQYEKPNELLNLNNEILINALSKLKRVSDLRTQHGRPIHFVEDEEWQPKPELFITAGYNYVLVNSGKSLSLRSELYHGVNLNNYIDIAPLAFEVGKDVSIQGKMVVRFVNAQSVRKDLAIRYLEYDARIENNPRTYYATHPGVNTPLENQNYKKKMNELQKERDELVEILNTTEGVDRMDIEDTIHYIDSMLNDQEAERWLISGDMLASYRESAPQIRFFDESVYVSSQGSALDRQLDPIYQRYANGQLTLQTFIDELSQKLQMVYLEGN